ncbi:MAG TPA: VCBS repeat-containing protein, partial [Gemmataceae bacterium]|nr:VCBS repeat-containing protein [Gemmataceae bacterium]
FAPTDRRCGSVAWLRGRADGSFAAPVVLLENVGRVADVQAADFRGTGKLDLVVAVFGLQAAGEVILLENHTTDWDKPKFVPRQVDARHGAIHVPVADLDGDGRPDFVALFAQEHEIVVAFLNDGRGGFRSETLYRAPHPAYGSSGIELVDLNGDGKLDVLYSNGDILDEPFLLKGYHSVQWLENKGGLKFEHHAISPMYGVHRAVAGDVLGNDRKDVVAVSFLPHDKFPDRVTRQADAVVVFEQSADGRFERHPLLTVDCDSVVCVVGDLYGTGRQDIVVGNFSSPKSDHPVTIWRNMGRTGGR